MNGVRMAQSTFESLRPSRTPRAPRTAYPVRRRRIQRCGGRTEPFALNPANRVNG